MTTLTNHPATELTTYDRAALLQAHAEAAAWTKYSDSPERRAYYRGMRDTLAVLLGLTTQRPTVTGPGSDVAATLMLPACRPQRVR